MPATLPNLEARAEPDGVCGGRGWTTALSQTDPESPSWGALPTRGRWQRQESTHRGLRPPHSGAGSHGLHPLPSTLCGASGTKGGGRAGGRQELNPGPKQFSSETSPHLKCFFHQPPSTEGPGLGQGTGNLPGHSLYANERPGQKGLCFLCIQGGLSLYLHNFTRLHHREFYDLKTRLPLISQEPDEC